MKLRLRRYWTAFWMRWAGRGTWGRLAMRAAGSAWPPYYGRHRLAKRYACGYIGASAELAHPALDLGPHVFLDERVLIFGDEGAGRVSLGPHVRLYRDTIVQTGEGGALSIGAGSSVQARCVLSAYVGPIRIGRNVQIAANCGFFSYAHGMAPGRPMVEQPLSSRGGIQIGDDVWIGYGATILDGARIGEGAVIGAGAVVSGTIPPRSVAVGVPARVVRQRGGRPAGARPWLRGMA